MVVSPLLTWIVGTFGLTCLVVPSEAAFLDCLQANKTCHMDQKCKTLLSVIPKQCGDTLHTEGDCTKLQIGYCTQSLNDIIQFHYFQSCQCPHSMPSYEECETFRDSLFLHKCAEVIVEQDRFIVQTRPADSSSPPSLYSGMDNRLPTMGGGNDCLEMRKMCQGQRRCSRDLTAFRQHCKVRNGRCYADSQEKCIEAYEALRPSGMFHCSCDGEKKSQSRRKCNGILRRFAKNACLMVANREVMLGKEAQNLPNNLGETGTSDVSATSEEADDYDTNWEEETDTDMAPKDVPMEEVDCYKAFASCNADSVCRLKIGKFLTACQWDLAKNTCDRDACLPAMADFFQSVHPQNAHAAAFCTCEVKDKQCLSLRGVLQPKCARVLNPAPSCLVLHRRCLADDACRKRFEYYENYCQLSKTGECTSGRAMCRDAVVGLLGTELMTNCTCSFEVAINRCKAVEKKLRNNKCRMLATSPEGSRPEIVEPTPAPNDGREEDTLPLQVDMVSVQRQKTRACSRKVGLQVQTNSSGCDELCRCWSNGTLTCQGLSCPTMTSCLTNGIQHAHGTMFMQPRRGQCTCRNGETICAKSIHKPRDEGVFLFVGYSIGDMLNLANKTVKISYSALSSKLTKLLNGKQFPDSCHLSKYSASSGNIAFRVNKSRPTRNSYGTYYGTSWNHYQQKQIKFEVEEGCFYKAKLLEIMINGRQNNIGVDPDLSVIRMATVETIHGNTASRHSGARRQGHLTVLQTVVLVLIYTAIVLPVRGET